MKKCLSCVNQCYRKVKKIDYEIGERKLVAHMMVVNIVLSVIVIFVVGKPTEQQLQHSTLVVQNQTKTFSGSVFKCSNQDYQTVSTNREMITISCNITFVEPYLFEDCDKRRRDVRYDSETQMIVLVEECRAWLPKYALSDYFTIFFAWHLSRAIICIIAALVLVFSAFTLGGMFLWNIDNTRSRFRAWITCRKKPMDFL